MIRTQIYLTEEEHSELRRIADLRDTSQSDVIRQAIDQFLAAYQQSNRVEMMRAARGIWADRTDFDGRALRSEFDRDLEAGDDG
jgi:predicted transcriptional regulator